MNPMLPIALAAILMQGPATHPPRVSDPAKLFSGPAASRAERDLDEVARGTGWDVALRTVESLGGRPIRDEAVAGARAANVHGLFVLISKGDRKFYAVPSSGATRAFTPDGIKAIDTALASAFKAGKFDDGLDAAVREVRTLASARPSTAHPVGVRDRAKLFSTEAVARADDALRAFERDSKWQVAVATIDSLGGKDIKARAEADAAASQVHGLFVLVSKADHKIEIVPSHSAEATFPKEKLAAVASTMRDDFRAGKFDQGLADAVAEIRRVGAPRAIGLATGPAPSAPPPGPEKPPLPARSVAQADAPPPPSPVEPKAPEAAPNPSAAPVPALPVTTPANRLPMYVAIGLGVLFLLWILSRAFGGSRQAPPPVQYAPSQPPVPAPGYAPPVANQPPAGYPPPQRPAPAAGYGTPPGYGQPGYGQPGYGPPPGYAPPPNYGPGGYGPPPPQPSAGGGFLGGAMAGLGGAVVGNILYDKFGRPHEGHPGTHPEGHAPAPVDRGDPGPIPTQPAAETYDANAGAGASWDAPPAEQPGPAGDWGTPTEAVAGGDWSGSTGGGDWGAPEAPAAEAGGDWGTPVADQGGGGEWGSAPADEAGTADWGAPAEDPGTGSDPEPDPEQGGGW